MKKTFGFGGYDLLHFVLLLIADTLAIGFALWVGHTLWVASAFRIHQYPPSFHLVDLLTATSIMVITLIWRGNYQLHQSVMHVVKLKELIRSALLGYLLVMLIGFVTHSMLIIISRLWAFYSFFLLIPVIIVERGLMDVFWSKIVTKGANRKRVLIYGAGFTGKRLVKSIQKMAKLNYEVVGFIDDSLPVATPLMANPVYVLGGFDDIPEIVKRENINQLFIALPNVSADAMRKILDACERLKIQYKFVPGLHEMALHRVQMEILDGIPLFSQRNLRLTRVQLFIKRAEDIVISFLALLILSPVMGLIALWIKKDSPGPVIFKQTRVGKDGKEFTFLKFRSMYLEAPQYAHTPQNSRDPRITPAGRFLRRTSLDELPQFWNVLRGDLSIVGPRPEMPFIVANYNELQRERLNVKPGITGLWQISIDRALPIHENVDHDLYYIENQSFLLDLVIIIETLFYAIRGTGAY